MFGDFMICQMLKGGLSAALTQKGPFQPSKTDTAANAGVEHPH